MTDNVVSLSLPEGNPEIVEDFRVMLSEAQNARIVSYVTVRIDHTGRVSASYFYDNNAHELALGSIVNAERVFALTD